MAADGSEAVAALVSQPRSHVHHVDLSRPGSLRVIC